MTFNYGEIIEYDSLNSTNANLEFSRYNYPRLEFKTLLIQKTREISEKFCEVADSK
ncbi:hypothetical protein AWA1501_21630 [Lactiplantibacillus pentosus]|nr:hypothetical protein AWA1501_21630 [Lactiplantibacillus pentosus]